MKFAIALLAGLTMSASVYAVQDGVYNCASKDGSLQITYKVTTVVTNGISLPFLEVTKKFEASGATPKIYTIKGIATEYTTTNGASSLGLGNMSIALTDGRPSCAN